MQIFSKIRVFYRESQRTRHFTWESVELDGVIDRSRCQRIRGKAQRERSDPTLVVAEDVHGLRRLRLLVDGNGRIGCGGGRQVVAVAVPEDGADGRRSGDLVGFSKLQRSPLHIRFFFFSFLPSFFCLQVRVSIY